MPFKSRLILAAASCLCLSGCGLINTALQLAPYYFLFADESTPAGTAGKGLEMRGREVQGRGVRGIPGPSAPVGGSQVAFKH